jgi:hypothetical protein
MEYKMQNINYFGVMKCKMPKFSELCLVLFKMLKFLGLGRGSEDSFGVFFGLLRSKSRMQNVNHFANEFWMVFSPILQNGEPKPKFLLTQMGN